jgi:hypothetical protein
MNNISAEAKVIAAFTFVAALLFGGWSSLTLLIARILSTGLVPEMQREVFSFLGLIAIAGVTIVAIGIARAASRATTNEWARHLGGATVVLAAIVLVASVLSFLASLGGASPFGFEMMLRG